MYEQFAMDIYICIYLYIYTHTRMSKAVYEQFASRDYAMREKVLTCLNLKVSKWSCLRGTPPRRVAFSKGS